MNKFFYNLRARSLSANVQAVYCMCYMLLLKVPFHVMSIIYLFKIASWMLFRKYITLICKYLKFSLDFYSEFIELYPTILSLSNKSLNTTKYSMES